MKPILAILLLILLQSCATQAVDSRIQGQHTFGLHDLQDRLRLTFQLPPEFTVNESVACHDQRRIAGVLSCGPHGEGDPDILGYFKEEQRGLRVSAWISVMGNIWGSEEHLALLKTQGKVVAQRNIEIDGNDATVVDIEFSDYGTESMNRYNRWVMFKLKNMSVVITFIEYEGREVRREEFDMYGVYKSQGVSHKRWRLEPVIAKILGSVKVLLPNE